MAKANESPFYLPVLPFNQNSESAPAIIEENDKFNPAIYCRTCANVDSCLVPIFKGDGLDHELNKKIEKYLPIQISQEDDLPVQLCYHCASTLIAWDTLIAGCIEAEKKLKSLKDSFKNEESVKVDEDEVSIGDINMSDNADSDDEPLITKKYAIRKGVKRKSGRRREILQEKKDVQKDTKTDVNETKRLTEIQDLTFSAYRRYFGVRNSLIVELFRLKDNQLFFKIPSAIKISGPDSNSLELPNHQIDENSGDNSDPCDLLPEIPELEKKMPVICKDCGKTLSSQKSLNNHMKIHSNEKPMTCHKCGKGFKHRFNLIRHLKVVHEGVRNHACSDCGKRYRSQGELEDHKNVHGNQMKIVCEECGRIFYTKASFYPHRKSHKIQNVKVDPTKFSCSECGKSFTSKKSRNEHLLIHSGEKPLVCTICNKRFRTRANYTQHVKVHSDVKLFKCEHCGKKFGRKDHLTIHVRCHTGEKPFVCNCCGRGFAQMSDLKKHMKIHGKKN